MLNPVTGEMAYSNEGILEALASHYGKLCEDTSGASRADSEEWAEYFDNVFSREIQERS